MKLYIVGYTYEADYHCPECAEARFGREALDEGTAIDGEGNKVHAMFAIDEQPASGVWCGDCQALMAEPEQVPVNLVPLKCPACGRYFAVGEDDFTRLLEELWCPLCQEPVHGPHSLAGEGCTEYLSALGYAECAKCGMPSYGHANEPVKYEVRCEACRL